MKEMSGSSAPCKWEEECGEDWNEVCVEEGDWDRESVMEKKDEHVLSDIIKWFWSDRSKFSNVLFRCFVNERIKSKSDWEHKRDNGQENEKSYEGEREGDHSFSASKQDGDE